MKPSGIGPPAIIPHYALPTRPAHSERPVTGVNIRDARTVIISRYNSRASTGLTSLRRLVPAVDFCYFVTSMLKIATWNVNSLRVRLEQVLDWAHEHDPDILALQETKLQDEDFPLDVLRTAGFEAVYAGQKTYNGVALLSRRPASAVISALPGMDDDPQRRLLAASYGELRVINVYVPNGESVGSEKYRYKLRWLENLATFIEDELRNHSRLVVLGDFNIAPEPRDVHDPALWEGRVLFSAPEREAFARLLATGLCDTFRLFDQEENAFSWWDYRMAAFRRNLGLRIDHILASRELCGRCRDCRIDKAPRGWQRPSDHAPVAASFEC